MCDSLMMQVDPESFLFAEGYSREAFWKRNAGESGFMKQKQKMVVIMTLLILQVTQKFCDVGKKQ